MTLYQAADQIARQLLRDDESTPRPPDADAVPVRGADLSSRSLARGLFALETPPGNESLLPNVPPAKVARRARQIARALNALAAEWDADARTP